MSRKQDELKGFEEIMDLIKDSDAPPNAIDKRKIADDSYELYGFLEMENERLGAIDRFFSSKVKTQMMYPQTDGLLQEQLERRSLLKQKLVSIIKRKDSEFYKSLERLFNKSFGGDA